MDTVWSVNIKFGIFEARGLGETPDEALKAIIHSWREYCSKIGRGDPEMIGKLRKEIVIERLDVGRGYIFGVLDSFEPDVRFDPTDARFDDLFDADYAPTYSR
jgi:hypothetical protein